MILHMSTCSPCMYIVDFLNCYNVHVFFDFFHIQTHGFWLLKVANDSHYDEDYFYIKIHSVIK